MFLQTNNVLVAIGVLLLGSNIALTVPAGKSTESAGDAANHDVQETLAEIHGPDDQLFQSREGDGSECLERSYSTCASGHADDLARHQHLAMLLDSAAEIEIKSSGMAGDTGRTEPASTFAIKSSQSTRYYAISGDTSRELWNELRGDANPLSALPGVGRKPLGEASFVYRYNYQSGYAANASHCLVKSGEIEIQFETVLPRLENLEHKPDRLQRQWINFQSVVVDHEVGHLKIYRRLLDELPQAMSDVGAVPCDQLDSKIVAAIDRVVDSIQLASSHYDAHAGAEKFIPSGTL